MSHTLAELDEFRRALRVGDVVRLKKLMGKSELPFYKIDQLPYLWHTDKLILPRLRCMFALWSDLSVEVTQAGPPQHGAKRHCKGLEDQGMPPVIETVQKVMATRFMTDNDQEQWSGTLELLEKFKADPAATQRRLRAELGFKLDPNAPCEPCTCNSGLCCPGFGCQDESEEEHCDHFNCGCDRPCCAQNL